MAARRVNDDASRLVDDQQVAILVGDRERRLRSIIRRRRIVVKIDAKQLTTAQKIGFARGTAVDRDSALLDPALGLRA
jgi:hypothetical protein